MKSMKSPLVIIALAAAMNSAVEARHGHGTLAAPRRHHGGYDYHRRHRPSAIDLVSDIFSVPFYSSNSLFRQQQDQLALLERTTAPRYSITQSDDGKIVELAMEVPGVPAKDLTVEVENGNVLRIRGSRTIRESGSLTKTEFDQSFQLDEHIDVENISVSLSSGILSITAPKKEPVVKRIQLKIAETESIDDCAVESANGEARNGVVGSAVEAVHGNDEEHATGGATEEDFVITEDGDSV